MAISNLPKLNFSVPFAMTAALPVEYNAYFDSYDAAVAAAATADVPGSSTTVYYYGQKIVVVTAESADLYIIQPDKTLKAAGTVPVGDNKSITVSDGVIGITGFAAATENQQLRKKADGTIEWYTPDTSTVAGLIQTVGQHTQQISTLNEQMTTVQGDITTINSTLADKANSADVYTKQQTDDKISAAISSVYKPAGSTAFADLPAASADTLGNVYNVTDAFTTTDSFVEGAGKSYPAGTNVAVVLVGEEYKYDVLSGMVDLSDYSTTDEIAQTYATKTEVTTGLSGKVDKVDGSRLMTDAEGTKLAGIEAGAQVNNIASVASGELAISESKELSIVAVAQDKVTGLVDALAGKVNTEAGKGLSTNDFTTPLLEKLNALPAGAQVNAIDTVSDEFTISETKELSVAAIAQSKITGLPDALNAKLESVSIAGTALTVTDKGVNIPIATDTLLGVVKSSAKINEIAVGDDGVMSVNTVSTDKLEQGSDTIVWNSGGATI